MIIIRALNYGHTFYANVKILDNNEYPFSKILGSIKKFSFISFKDFCMVFLTGVKLFLLMSILFDIILACQFSFQIICIVKPEEALNSRQKTGNFERTLSLP